MPDAAVILMLPPVTPLFAAAGPAALWLLVGLAPLVIFFALAAWSSHAPLRRMETARLLLDLIQSSVENDKDPRESIIAASRTLDPEIAETFHDIACGLERGETIAQSLKYSGIRLPPAFTPIIAIGERTGRLNELLPAADRILRDGQKINRNTAASVIGLAFVVAPFAILMLAMLRVYVFPKFNAIMADMLGGKAPELASWAFAPDSQWLNAHILLMLLIWGSVLVYVATSQGLLSGTIADRINLLIPWRRRRMQRDFSTALGVLLDASLDESESVRLAADASGNQSFRERAGLILENLAQGMSLPEAVRPLDNDGQFRWRLSNAADASLGFMKALAGWQEDLDARAFFQEQAMTHGLAAFLVVWNGIVVGGIAFCVFQFLVHTLNLLLW